MVVTDRFNQLLGSVECVGDTSVRTLFFVIGMLPIYPQGSFAVTKRGDEKTVMEIKQNPRSVLAGYLRWWPGSLGMLGAVLGGSAIFYMNEDDRLLAYVVTGVSLFLLLVAGLMFLLTRAPVSAEERAQRLVYSEFAGAPVDVAKLKDSRHLRDEIKRFLADRAQALGATQGQKHGYGYDQWHAIALDPRMTDVAFLRGALTVARLLSEDARTDDAGVGAAGYQRVHATVWGKLRAVGGAG